MALKGTYTMAFILSPLLIMRLRIPMTWKEMPSMRMLSPIAFWPENSFFFTSAPITATRFMTEIFLFGDEVSFTHINMAEVLVAGEAAAYLLVCAPHGLSRPTLLIDFRR